MAQPTILMLQSVHKGAIYIVSSHIVAVAPRWPDPSKALPDGTNVWVTGHDDPFPVKNVITEVLEELQGRQPLWLIYGYTQKAVDSPTNWRYNEA